MTHDTTVSTPVASIEAALPLLRRPPAPGAVKFRPLNDLGDRCQVVAYTDARFVIDCLNAVCGGHWRADYQPVHAGLVPSRREDEPMLYARCDLTVFDVTRTDVGECRDDTRNGAGTKALLSDALKRAAVHFGINQAIYAMRTPWLDVHAAPGMCPPGRVRRSASGALYVPDPTQQVLRHAYGRWLGTRGAAFGEPIDFGEGDATVGGPETENAATNGTVVALEPAREARGQDTRQALAEVAELAHGLRYETDDLAALGRHVCDADPATDPGALAELRAVLQVARETGAAELLRDAVRDTDHPDRAIDLLARLRGRLAQRSA